MNIKQEFKEIQELLLESYKADYEITLAEAIDRLESLEKAIIVTRSCELLKDKEAPTFEQWKKDNFTSEINIHKCLKNGRTWGSTEIYSLYNWLYK